MPVSDRLGYKRQAALRKRLVARTVRYAIENIPYYRSLFGRFTPEISLTDLPIVDKDLMSEQLDSFTNFSHIPEVTITTGGTTRSPSITFQSRAELDRMMAYGYDLRPGEPYPQSVFTHFTLHVGITGPSIVGAVGRPLLSLPLTQPGHSPLIRRFLEGGLLIGGRRRHVGVLLCPTRQLKLLTQLLMETNFKPTNTALRQILAYSDHVTQPWRTAIRKYWGCDVTPVYGLSEFNYAAVPVCATCLHYHLPSFVHVEIVRPDRRGVSDTSDGVLVLTSLHPFVKSHPHIRYWTGDVVRRGPYCETAREPGLRFLGRLEHVALVLDRDGYRCLLSPFDIMEAAEEIDGVDFEDFSPVGGCAAPHLPKGGPIVRITPLTQARGAVEVILDVGMRDRARAANLRPEAAWEKALSSQDPAIMHALQAGLLKLIVKPQAVEAVRGHPRYQSLS